MQELTSSACLRIMPTCDLHSMAFVLSDDGWSKSTRLLTVDSNPKTSKNAKVGDYTAIMNLLPHKASGKNVCPWASAGCIAACLHTAGNKAYMPAKIRARGARTALFFDHRDLFIEMLYREIDSHIRRAERLELSPSIRLNGTSDLPWEKLISMGHIAARFYDYTKSVERAIRKPYHLTFSRSECNDAECRRVLDASGTVAVVVEGYGISAHPKPLPHLSGMFGIYTPVIDGDVHDVRHMDRGPAIVALRAKGDAIGDTSGFVVSRSEF